MKQLWPSVGHGGLTRAGGMLDPHEGPIQLEDRHELSALEHTLDPMAASENLEIAVLQRAVRKVLGLGSPLLDEMIGD